jgi:hypothetical protein
MTKTKQLPDVGECIAYVKGLGYALVVRRRGFYMFRDITGQRPEHNREMTWNLTEMRDAVRYGC